MTEERDDIRFDVTIDEARLVRWAIQTAIRHEGDGLAEPAENALVRLHDRLGASLLRSPWPTGIGAHLKALEAARQAEVLGYVDPGLYADEEGF